MEKNKEIQKETRPSVFSVGFCVLTTRWQSTAERQTERKETPNRLKGFLGRFQKSSGKSSSIRGDSVYQEQVPH